MKTVKEILEYIWLTVLVGVIAIELVQFWHEL